MAKGMAQPRRACGDGDRDEDGCRLQKGLGENMEGSQLASLFCCSWAMMGAGTGRPGDKCRIHPSVLPWDTPGIVCFSSSPSQALPSRFPGREGAVIY